jgi:hypothetical protein
MRKPKPRSRAPLGIAAFIGIPLFFSALMASSLAIEKPTVIAWHDGSVLHVRLHDPSASNELHIWLWAMVPPLLLVLAGWAATYLPYGFYLACVAAVLDAMAVVHNTGTWAIHHTLRFPTGVDLIPTSSISNRYDPGEWEAQARQTALSLSHWTIGIALGAILVSACLAGRRRLRERRLVPVSGA